MRGMTPEEWSAVVADEKDMRRPRRPPPDLLPSGGPAAMPNSDAQPGTPSRSAANPGIQGVPAAGCESARVSETFAKGEVVRRRPSRKELAAKHAEIARHYAQRGKATRNDKRLRELRELRRIRERLGGDTTSVDEALKAGGWPDTGAVDAGIVLQFSFAEAKDHAREQGRHMNTLTPCDIPSAEWQAYLTVFNRPKRAARMRGKRQRERAAAENRRAFAADLDCRQSAIMAILPGKGRCTVMQIANALANHKAFRCPNGEGQLTSGSLRRAIRRELGKMEKAGRISINKRPGKHGVEEFVITIRG